jgi:hypothetical protein
MELIEDFVGEVEQVEKKKVSHHHAHAHQHLHQKQ